MSLDTAGAPTPGSAVVYTFYGAHCDMVEAGEVDSIDVDFGCPGPLI